MKSSTIEWLHKQTYGTVSQGRMAPGRRRAEMPSPFPGMNPYLEQSHIWRDFYGSFLVTLRSALTPLLVPRYH